MRFIWDNLLYAPLLNTLIFLYTTVAFDNMVIAVVEFTILVRFILLPFSIIAESNKSKYLAISKKVKKLAQSFPGKTVEWNIEVRRLLKESKVSPWANMVLFLTQLGILVLLYSVFMGGVQNHLDVLYSVIAKPKFLQLQLGPLNVGEKNTNMALIVALMLFGRIIVDQSRRRCFLTESDKIYRIVFPLMTFVILMFLPSVKALFVLVSMLFTSFVHYFKLLYDALTADDKKNEIFEPPAQFNYAATASNPWDALKK